MASSDKQSYKRSGLRRLIAALGHQRAGVKHALLHDPAVRQVSLAVFLLTALALVFPISALEKLLLIYATGQVLVLELVNSSVEAVVDRISLEIHPLSKVAKDLCSVAVALAATLAIIAWVIILYPLAARFCAVVT